MRLRLAITLLAAVAGAGLVRLGVAARVTHAAAGLDRVEKRLLAEFAGAYPPGEPAGGAGVERSFEIRAAPAEVSQLDGGKLRVWSYNGQVPGATLRVRLGDSVRVVLRNDLPQATTIHWHGVRVPNAMDGVPGVTQPPVEPGDTFVYRFAPKDAGTFWFHPHHRGSEQVERGLYGVLVVEDETPLPWSKDVVWVIDDWLITREGEIDPRFNTRRDLMHDGRWGNVVTVNGSTREELTVRAGERVRLRLLNSANGRVFAPDFSALDARVIAVDGLYTARPLDPAGIEVSPGARVDLDVRFRKSDRGRTFAIADRFTRRPIPLAAIRVLDEAEVETPDFPPPSNPRVPAWREALDAPVFAEYRLNSRRGGEFGIEWTINDEAWAHHGPMPGVVARLDAGRFHRLRFVNESFRLHPMHLHGQFFKVLARNGKPVEEPFFRDSVLLTRQETVDVGLVPLDPGRWMMHCHIQEHAEAGMMTLFEVGPPG
ncbi:MAG: multicopper oxidase family protein [Candidatus Binatia bacterium]